MPPRKDIPLRSPNPPREEGSPQVDRERTKRPSAPGEQRASGGERDPQVGDPETKQEAPKRLGWVAPPDLEPTPPAQSEDEDTKSDIPVFTPSARPSVSRTQRPSGGKRNRQIGDPVTVPGENTTEAPPTAPVDDPNTDQEPKVKRGLGWVAPPDLQVAPPKDEDDKPEMPVFRSRERTRSGSGRSVQVGDPGTVEPKQGDEEGTDGPSPATPEGLPPAFLHDAKETRRSFPDVTAIKELPEKVLVSIKLFESFHEGSGYADATPMDRIDPTKGSAHFNRVHGSIDARWPGQLQTGQRVAKIATTNHDLNPVFAIEWTGFNDVHPAIYYIVGKTVQEILFGVVSEALSEGGTAQNANMHGKATKDATGGMFDDNGSGVPYLYACFGTAQKIVRMTTKQVYDDTMTGAATDIFAGLLLSLNGDAYRTIKPTGGTALCHVSKCPRGGDRMDENKWGPGALVGFAGTTINALTSVRQAPVAVKPEGVFAFNAGLDRWINYAPSWRTFMHLENGKGSYHLGDALIIPMGDGSTMIFDGNNVRPFDPGGPLATPNRHTTRDDFVQGTMMSMRHWVLGVTGHSGKLISAGDTLRVKYYDDSGSAYTDGSAVLRDMDLTTNLDINFIAAADILYIGWKRPFASVQLDMSTGNQSSVTMTVSVGTAAGPSPGSFTTVGVKNTGFRDFSDVGGAPLSQNGSIVMMVDPVEVGTGWIKTTVDSVEAYWMRLTFNNPLTRTIFVNASISPWYPSIDKTNFPLDGLDRSGVLPHIQYGRMGVNGQPWWHDLVSLPEPDRISQALYANVGGTVSNHARRILLIGRFAVWALEVADNDRPGYEAEPYLNDVGLIEATSFIPVPGKVVRLNKIIINGHEFEADVKTFFYYAWEHGHPFSRAAGASITVPSVLKNFPSNDKGTRFRWAWGFTSTSVTSESVAKPTIPTVTSIEAVFEVLEDAVDLTPERPMQDEPRN